MGGFSAGITGDISGSVSGGISASVSVGNSQPNAPPFTAFNFSIEIRVDGVSDLICGGAFSECDGLEMNIEPKTVREGGRNNGPVHLIGPVSYGQLSLRRGMTKNFDLWRWFNQVASRDGGGLRATAEVVMLASDGNTEQARFVLSGCLPVKLRAASLNAKDGQIAVEEISIAYENLNLQGIGGGIGLGVSVGLSAGGSVGFSAGVSGGVNLDASASVNASLSGGIGF